MLTRENFTGRVWRRNARSRRTTAGTLITRLTARSSWSYSSITSTLPRNSSEIARCHELTLIGSNPWFSSRVCAVSIDPPLPSILAPPLRPSSAGFGRGARLKTIFKNGTHRPMATLADQPLGHTVTVVGVDGPRAFRRRLLEMGLVPGTDVRIVTVAPLGDPLQIEVRGGQWSIRRVEAAQIQVGAGPVGARS